MPVIDTLNARNAAFAASEFSAELKIMPSMRTLIIGCVDPRVDPSDVLGLTLGEAAIIRNVGGRVTPDVFATLAMLGVVSRAGGGQLGAGWNLIVLQHTDCGITRLGHSPEMLAPYFGVTSDALDGFAVDDPYAAVAVDVTALRTDSRLPSGFEITGLVYDVATGHVDVVAG